nr:NF-kappa-B inhibitor cactus [Gryllodes sigillatus]
MWHQQHPATGHIDDVNLVSDCASGQQTTTARYSHAIPTHSGSAYGDHSWIHGRDSQDIAVNRELPSQSFVKGYSDSGSNFYDSSRTDSGFLSGANLVSEQCISEEITCSGKSRDLSSHPESQSEEKEGYKDDMRLDSGVDVGLSDNFKTLSLNNTYLNDLNATPSQSSSVGDNALLFTNIVDPQTTKQTSTLKSTSPEQSPSNIPPVWELYFQQDEDGDTQLHIAIIQGFIEVVYSLINIAPHPCFLDIQNENYQTPLHLGVLTHQPKIVRRLLVAGASVDMRDRNGNTPLHMACHLGDLDCVKALTEPVTIAETDTANLQYTVYPQQLPQNLEEVNYDGQTCVHLAALSSRVDILRHLHWFGANINAREGKSGRTVLHYAVELGLSSVLHFLLEECAVQLEASTYAGHTAYQLAACIDSALAHQLSEHGALRKNLPDDSDSDSDYNDDDDGNEHEMYQKSSDDNFSSLRINGQPINISA